jgi:hypothetical protein
LTLAEDLHVAIEDEDEDEDDVASPGPRSER